MDPHRLRRTVFAHQGLGEAEAEKGVVRLLPNQGFKVFHPRRHASRDLVDGDQDRGRVVRSTAAHREGHNLV